MKKKNVMNDLWEYLAREAEDIKKTVLNQVPEAQEYQCEQILIDYLFYVRNMNIAEILKLNRNKNQYVELINKELEKRNIFINSVYIHISMPSIEDYGEEN